MTVKEFAAALGVPVSTVKNWQYNRNNPLPTNIRHMIEVFPAYEDDLRSIESDLKQNDYDLMANRPDLVQLVNDLQRVVADIKAKDNNQPTGNDTKAE